MASIVHQHSHIATETAFALGRYSMFAAVMKLTFVPELAPQAAAAFTGELLPRVKAMKGFKGGYWLDPLDGKGLGLILFEEEEQARHASLPDRWAAPGVTLDHVQIRRVAATA